MKPTTEGDRPIQPHVLRHCATRLINAGAWTIKRYGDDHRGVCLAFDRERFLEALMRELADSSRIIAAPVKYVKSLTLDALPSQPPADLTSDGFYAVVDDYLAKNAERLLFTKGGARTARCVLWRFA